MKQLLILSITLALVVACDDSTIDPGNEPNLRELSASEVQVTVAANEFAFDLFRKIQKASPQNNFISPLSISMALGMTLNGASNETQKTFLQTIHFGELTPDEINTGYNDLTSLLLSMDRKVKLGIANSVWYSDKYHVKENFSTTIAKYYDGKTTGINFSDEHSKDIINGWVEDKTNGRIKDLINQIASDEVMFLVNAIYFKGDWTYQFDKSKTHDAPFHKIDGSSTSVRMMHSEKVKLLHYSDDKIELLDIPYGNKQFNLTVIVPREPAKLQDLLSDLNVANLSFWLSEADSAKPQLELPKFKMTWKADLKEGLKEMGIAMAGFPDLFEETLPLEISRVIHQTYLDVNEEGTEAAAATAVGIEQTSIGPISKIVVDKPFIFLIREKHSEVILFIGQLIDPDIL
ncbi:MAG TPA: serpin family protein [Cyclobacteriaceae bacterium]|nr:serpin family protein [Cyclobacteriaceae bacterium]